MRKTLLLALALTAAAACEKGSKTSSTPAGPAAPAQAAAPTPAAAPAPAAPAAAAPAAEGALTGEKLEGFLVYQREMIPLTAKAMEMATGAYKKSAGDSKKFQNAMAEDERVKEFQAASEAALKKAGITMSDVSRLTLMTSSYFPQRSLAIDAQKQLDEIAKRKAAGKPGIADDALAKVHQETVESAKKARDEMEAKYGKPTVELLDKYEPQFIELQQQMLKNALGK